MPC
ncbi:hypothetical protein YPPY63_0202, partial [Yersinia pestis PY-63]|jgi:hypothetical protein